MTDKQIQQTKTKTELKTLKAIIKAGLTQAEMKLVYFYLDSENKFFVKKYDEKTGLTHSNYLRTLKSLIEKNVINDSESSKHKNNEMFITGFTKWGFKNKQLESK